MIYGMIYGKVKFGDPYVGRGNTGVVVAGDDEIQPLGWLLILVFQMENFAQVSKLA